MPRSLIIKNFLKFQELLKTIEDLERNLAFDFMKLPAQNSPGIVKKKPPLQTQSDHPEYSQIFLLERALPNRWGSQFDMLQFLPVGIPVSSWIAPCKLRTAAAISFSLGFGVRLLHTVRKKRKIKTSQFIFVNNKIRMS